MHYNINKKWVSSDKQVQSLKGCCKVYICNLQAPLKAKPFQHYIILLVVTATKLVYINDVVRTMALTH